jgi:hypothetical protein
MLLFAAATQGWFLTKNRFYESIALLLVAFTFFRPGFWMDMVSPPFTVLPPAQIEQAAMDANVGDPLRLQVDGLNSLGDPISFVAILPVGEGADGAERLLASGMEVLHNGDEVVVDSVAFGSAAQEAGFDWDQKITRVLAPADQPSKYWMFIPALLLLGLVVMLQRGRQPKMATA